MSLGDSVLNMIKSVLAGVHTAMPGSIEAYEHSTQKARVKPMLKRGYVDGTFTSFPVISEVPVVFPSCGGASLTFPVNIGDPVLLIFSERTMDNWLVSGKESTSQVERQFSINDAIAIPGLLPFSSGSQSSNNTDVELTFNNQKIILKPNGNIELGVGTLRELIDERIQSAFNNHTHLVASVGAPTGTPMTALQVPIVLGNLPGQTPVTTTKVKAL